MKNINSFQFILKAIEYEFARQVEVVENGGTIVQETRRYDQSSGKTFSMRSKEDADDYRYFPDPDLPPIRLSEEKKAQLQAEIPVLPDLRKAKYIKQYELSAYAAEQLTSRLEIAEYFEAAAENTDYPKLAANLMQSELLTKIGEDEGISIAPKHIAAVAQMLGEGEINNATARTVIAALWEADTDPVIYVEQHGLKQINDRSVLEQMAQKAIEADPKSVQAYCSGKAAAAQAIIGKLMKQTSGRGNPVLMREIVLEKLDQMK
jgi:aspartyl-tRNA(Asn)/glutamyl-tRNA(Gln) amidotransferase subunit B